MKGAWAAAGVLLTVAGWLAFWSPKHDAITPITVRCSADVQVRVEEPGTHEVDCAGLLGRLAYCAPGQAPDAVTTTGNVALCAPGR